MTINSFTDLLQHLDIPKACELNKPVFKKHFLSATYGGSATDSCAGKKVLDATDRRCLAGDVNKVRWLYSLKPSTINIVPYHDGIRGYSEVAVLQVELSSSNRVSRITHFINRSIRYPLVLLFTLDADGKTSVALSLADKRIDQADNEKWVLEDSIHSEWIELGNQQQAQAEFLAGLKIAELAIEDSWDFYQALMARVIASNCAGYSGVYTLDGNSSVDGSSRLEDLRELEDLDAQKNELENELEHEKQIRKQFELLDEIRGIEEITAKIIDDL